MKLVVIIPAYNEENTIAGVIKEIPRQIEGISSLEVLLIDDGSRDDTTIKAIESGVDEVVTHKVNRGLGASFRDGLDAALEKGSDIIVNIDADGQYNATQIPLLIKPIIDGKADIVLGWRDIDKLYFMPRGKKLGNKLATWLIRRLSGFSIKDAQTGFRAFSREAAAKLNLGGRYTYVQETIIQARYKGLQIEQVPIEFRDRGGKSRLITNLGTYAFRAGEIIFSTLRDFYPLKFFSSIGGIFIALGLGFGIRVLVYFSETGTISPHLPSTIAASFLMIMGLGTIALGIIAHILSSQRRLNEDILYRMKKKQGINGYPIHNSKSPHTKESMK